ncbi:MAG TPA: glycosyltransferase family 4 protein [Candidatus Limnocylindria bacterium]
MAWTTPDKATRSAWLARELGIDEPRYLAPTRQRGPRAALFKYPWQLVRTAWLLARRRPTLVLVQSPPSFAAWVAAGYTLLRRARFAIDAHSDAFERSVWTRPAGVTRFVARRAAVTIVTNEHWAHIVRGWGGRALVIRSLPTPHPAGDPPPMSGATNVAVVNTWASDEPLDAVLEAAASLPEIQFHVTGRGDRVARLAQPIPSNVHFTGFLDEPAYHGLLSASDAVICLTTRNHTMQNGASEAMSHGTPVITSDWPLLRDYFDEGTVHVDNTAPGIAAGVRALLADPQAARAGMARLRQRRREEWEAARAELVEILEAR